MASKLAKKVEQALKTTGISIKPEKRGEAKLPGVPDSVIWVRPSDLPVGRCLPLLFELENKGEFNNAYRDVEQFAERRLPNNRAEGEHYKYTVSWPTITRRSRENMTIPVNYEMVGMSTSSLVTGERDVSEGEFHRCLCAYYRSNDSAIKTQEVDIRSYDDTEVVLWTIEFNLTSGDKIEDIVLPFVISFGEDFEKLARERLPSMKLPIGVYIGGEGTNRTNETSKKTGIEFEYMRIREKV